MPFYLRKSVSVGPFRFNLSKSGIGVSAGVTGFRVGAGPRGSYIHVGRGGLYYRTSLNPAGQSAPRRHAPTFAPAETEPRMQEVETGDIMQMVDADAGKIIDQINEKLAAVPIWRLVALLGIAVVGFTWYQYPTTAGQYIGPIALVTVALALLALWRDSIRLKVVLVYDLDDDAATAFERLTDALDAVQSAARLWNIDAHAFTADWKRNAGATGVVKRQIAQIHYTTPIAIKTNVSVPALIGGKQRLYFFPDLLLVMERNRVGGIKYNDLSIETGHMRFVEDEKVPADANVIDYTWQYVNKDGGPDRRFSRNRQLPVCLYQAMRLQSPSGLNKLLYMSKSGDEAEGLRQAVRRMARTVEATLASRARSPEPETPAARSRPHSTADSPVDSRMRKLKYGWALSAVAIIFTIAGVSIYNNLQSNFDLPVRSKEVPEAISGSSLRRIGDPVVTAIPRKETIPAPGLPKLGPVAHDSDQTRATAGGKTWVTTDRLDRRTCPDVRCGRVGVFFFRESVTIHEEKSGWARVTHYYDASCFNGQSQFVDAGNAACTATNGIVNGQLAEWVSVQYLSSMRPPDPAAGATGDYALVSGSDDYGKYKDAFAKTAAQLISSGQCTSSDFQETGGWLKSTTHGDSPVYFTYCGGFTLANRLYLNAATGDVFK